MVKAYYREKNFCRKFNYDQLHLLTNSVMLRFHEQIVITP